MKAHRSGFTAIESVIGIALIVLIGSLVWLAVTDYKSNRKTTSTPALSIATSSSPVPGSKDFSGQDYHLYYPNDWTLKASSGGASALSIVGTPVNIGPGSDPANANGHVTVLEFTAGSDYISVFNRANGYTVPPVQTAVTMNGNPGYFSVENESYSTDEDYVIYHNGHAVDINFQLRSTDPAIDNSHYEAQFKAIAASLTLR